MLNGYWSSQTIDSVGVHFFVNVRRQSHHGSRQAEEYYWWINHVIIQIGGNCCVSNLRPTAGTCAHVPSCEYMSLVEVWGKTHRWRGWGMWWRGGRRAARGWARPGNSRCSEPPRPHCRHPSYSRSHRTPRTWWNRDSACSQREEGEQKEEGEEENDRVGGWGYQRQMRDPHI